MPSYPLLIWPTLRLYTLYYLYSLDGVGHLEYSVSMSLFHFLDFHSSEVLYKGAGVSLFHILILFFMTILSCSANKFATSLLSADLSSLPTIILRRFLFTNDPAYLLLSVALGDVFLLPPPFALRYPVHVA